jgi:hypothetical protein
VSFSENRLQHFASNQTHRVARQCASRGNFTQCYELAPILKEIKLAHLLYIEGSPRKARSASIEVADAALAAWRADDSTLDVWSEELPDFDGPVMEAKYAAADGASRAAAKAYAAEAVRRCADRVNEDAALRSGTALYSIKAVLSGLADDAIELVKDNPVK